MKFKKWLETVYTILNPNNEDSIVLMNPTKIEILNLNKRQLTFGTPLRAITSNDDVYAWREEDGSHYTIPKKLKLKNDIDFYIHILNNELSIYPSSYQYGTGELFDEMRKKLSNHHKLRHFFVDF